MSNNSDNSDNSQNPKQKSRRKFLHNAGLVGLAAATTVGAESVIPAQGKASLKDTADDSRATNCGAPIYDKTFTNEEVLPPLKERVLALKQLLIEKKLIDEATIGFFINYYEKAIGPHLGAAVVAHAWSNPTWKAQLLNPPADKAFAATILIKDFLFNTLNPATGKPYLSEDLTFGLTIGREGEYIRVLANGEQLQDGKTIFVHNLVTCTACSCYPLALLGLQPMWYKSQQYRARSVSEPLEILKEFAQESNQGKPGREKQFKTYIDNISELRVWDSNSEVRFFVIPEMPNSWSGLSEHELFQRITRNSMLGAEILYS